MTAPWLKFRNAEPAAEALAPAVEAGPWQKFNAPVAQEIPAFRNSADDVTGLTHRAVEPISPGVSSFLSELDKWAEAPGMLGVAGKILNAWGDAFENERENPRNVFSQIRDSQEGVLQGAKQGTNPNPKPEQQVLGNAFQDAGGAWMFQTPDGRGELVNPDKHVVLKDPTSGKLLAYSRSKQSDELPITGASRVITQGMLPGPVTGVARGTSLVNKAAGARPIERAAKAIEDLAAFDRSGVPVYAPAFSDGPGRGLAKSLADTPYVGRPLAKAADASAKATAERVDDIAGRFGTKPNEYQAGTTVREGIERFKDARPADVVGDAVSNWDDARITQTILAPSAETSFKTKQSALYERAWRLIPEEMQKGKSVKGVTRFMSNPANTRALLEEIAARNTRMINSKGGTREAPPMAGGLLGEMISAIRTPQWPANLQTLRNMRSEVRRLASGMADTEKNVLKASDLDRIQASLTQDMVEQLQKNVAHYRDDGDILTADKIDRAIKEFSRADQYTRLSIERMEKIEKLFNASTGEALARNITNAAIGGGKGNIEMLQTLAKTLRPDEMGEVRSMIFSTIGRPVPSGRGAVQEMAFSPNTFTTTWNKMSPEAKALLFDGEHKKAIDDIAAVASRLSNVDAMGNPTHSGHHATTMAGLMGGLGYIFSGGGAALAGSVGGSYALSVLLSRPAYAKWTAQYLKLKSQTAAPAKALDAALAVQVNRLAQMAQHDPQLMQVVQQLRLSPAEDGVRQGPQDHRPEKDDRAAPGEGEGNQGSNNGASPNHGGSVSSGGLMINPLAIVQRMKQAWDDTRQPVRDETRGAIVPAAQYEDGSYHVAVPGAIKSIGDFLDLGGEQAAETRTQGNLRPEDQDWEKAKELAGKSGETALNAMTGGFGMTVAGKGVPTGAVGIFGGRLAKTADQAALARAEEMAKAGADREAIWNETGWLQGSDGKWRFEIDDSKSEIPFPTQNDVAEFGGASGTAMRAGLRHDDLYQAYPDARRTEWAIADADSPQGSFVPRGDRPPYVSAQGPTSDAQRSVLLHELQHGVARGEGFDPGSSPGSVPQAMVDRAREDFLRLPETNDWSSVNTVAPESIDSFIRYNLYRNNPGEIEARNVQTRRDMTADERRATPPWLTEDGAPGPAIQADPNAPQSAIPFFGRGRQGPEQALEAVSGEIAELSGRYRQLFGKDFVAPKARPGTPTDEILKGEQQTLEELRTIVTSKEAALAKMPDVPSTPKIRDVSGERDELLQQARDNPFVKAVPGKQGLPKKKEELDAIERFYKNGGSLPPGPWGRDPLDYQKAVREAFDDTRQQIAKLNEEKAAAKSEGQVAKLKTELKAANEMAVKLQSVINQLQKIIMPRKD